MSPGINGGGGGGGGGGGPRNTGTLPKSNRRSDRNRERSAANQQNRSVYHGHPQHFNNLVNPPGILLSTGLCPAFLVF